MKLTEQDFQTAVRYGGIALVAGVVLSVYVVMRNVELFRDASRAEQRFQQDGRQQQAMQGLLQEFERHAASDRAVAEIFRNAQAAARAANEPTTAGEPKP